MTTLSPSEIISLLGNAYGRPPGDALAELVLTLLSQNTSDTNSGRAFARLMAAFPDWDTLIAAPVERVEEAIQPGGLAPTKAPRLQALLREVWSRRNGWDLSFLADRKSTLLNS